MGGTSPDGLIAGVESILKPGGLLDDALDRYEFRPQQVEMARAVLDALTDRHPLIVEAATGTGKTIAYLVPAILSGKRVVISTGTKALQEQLYSKDLPLLEQCMERPFEAVLLKGRRNYLCKHRFQEMQRTKAFRSKDDVKLWPVIQRWADRTDSGDRAEIEGMPDYYPTWQDLSVGSEACLGRECQYWDDCFVQKARRRAQEADIIVVNHHLFFADLSLKAGGFGEVLPEYDAVVFDEAHHIEQVATEYFGIQVSNYRFRDLSTDAERALEAEEVDADKQDKVKEAGRAVERVAGKLFDHFDDSVEKGRHGLVDILNETDDERLETRRRRLDEKLDDMAHALQSASMGEVGQRLASRCDELSTELDIVLAGDDTDYAYVAERRDSGLFLQASPIDLASELQTKLLETHDSLVFTSATLATGGDFSFFKRRIGFADPDQSSDAIDVDERLLEPVFDYDEQCLLYVPRKLPAPSDPDFCKNMALIVDYLVDITDGRAFILFTSYNNMNDVHDRLVDDLDYPVFLQGELSKRELLESFRNTPNAVLFATASFWEGVDVEGESLSLVVIDKLPFANPSDPLTKARLELADEQSGNSFYDVSLPTAAISLRQGFGRLIRSTNDRGVVAVLDSRIAHKRYGNYFLESLPPAPVVWTAPAVKRWWYNGGSN